MPINHSTTKNAGDKILAADWNADHTLPSHNELPGIGPNDHHTPPTVTKEFYVPVTGGTTLQSYSGWWGAYIDSSTDEAYITFMVSQDFTSLSNAEVTVFWYPPGGPGTYTHRLNLYSEYGNPLNEESANTHSGSLLDQDYTKNKYILGTIDISGLLGSLAAGDEVSIKIVGDATNVPKVMILGVRIKYD